MLQEIKGKLAKLLATENLIVEHRTVETAQFDVVRRVLTLPNWQISSIDVYDLLVAHEVGHALFTDPRDWSLEPEWCDVPQTFVNITEDARIEKLMKRKYAGLSKTFYRGYSDLNDSDFFDIEEGTNSWKNRISFYEGNTEKSFGNVPQTGDGSYERVAFNAVGIDRLVIRMPGSGAIDNLVFRTGHADVPAPASLAVLLLGIVALSFRKIRG